MTGDTIEQTLVIRLPRAAPCVLSLLSVATLVMAREGKKSHGLSSAISDVWMRRT